MPKSASIDIGSNTILLLVAENGRELYSISEIAGLGRGIDKSKQLSPEAIRDAFVILESYYKKLQSENINPKDVIITATEAVRVAKNACEFCNEIQKKFAFTVQVITSKAEAYFTALGVASDPKVPHEFAVLDIGGASTEIMHIKRKSNDIEIIRTISLPVGSVRCSEWIKEGTFDQKMNEKLTLMPSDFHSPFIICVAGSMTSVAGVYHGLKQFEEEKIHGTIFNQYQFSNVLTILKGNSPEELLTKYPFLGKRAPTVLGGAKVGFEIGKKIGVDKYQISTLGLRHGTLSYMLKTGDRRIQDDFIFRKC